MRIIRPKASATASADRRIINGLKCHNRFRKKCKAGGDYLGGTHSYKLMANGKDTGDRMITEGRQAKTMNDVLREMFQEEVREEIDAGVKFGEGTATLKRWCVVERNVPCAEKQQPADTGKPEGGE